MFPGMLGTRRLLIAAIVVIAFAAILLSQAIFSGVSWDDVSQTVPMMSSPERCPVFPEIKAGRQKVGRLHYMIPGSTANKELCRALVSSTVTRYGPPIIAGYHASGENDAGVTHLAKVRVITNYLESLPAEADDDLFLMIDGYDVQVQLGPDVLIQRYFKAVEAEDDRIIQQLGPSRADEVAGPLGRHIMFGADKVCWPTDFNRPACWAVPEVPGMDGNMFGPETGKGDNAFSYPRWLNSGTIMGPIKETRALFRATLDYIDVHYDEKSEFKESDQFYMANMQAEQEVYRINAQVEDDPKSKHPKGGHDASKPKLEAGKKYNYHIAIDYWSILFQTWAGYTDFVGWHKFDGPQNSFVVDQNVRGEPNFKPWNLPLDGDAMRSIDRVFNTTQDPSMGETSTQLIKKSEFGANIVTKTTLPFYHCTGAKGALDEFWPRMWFFKHAKAMVRSAVQFYRSNEPLAPFPIDNRMWYPAKAYPDDIDLNDGGAWSDGSDDSGEVKWLTFNSMCKEHRGNLFGD